MKQKVEEVLDSLIVAHRIEEPDRFHFLLQILESTKVLLLTACIIALAVAGVMFLPQDITVSGQAVTEIELPIYSVATAKAQVALTFDTTGGNEDIGGILKVLAAHGVKATFFLTGRWVEDYPETVKAIQEAGHDLGNHSESHKSMNALPPPEIRDEILTLHNKVEELTGYEMFLFRPPYGEYDKEVIKGAYDNGYYPIQWNVDSLDWKDYGANAIIKEVCGSKQLECGAIIRCHTGTKYTLEALDAMLSGLKDMGFEVVAVSELIYRDNYYMNEEGRQMLE